MNNPTEPKSAPRREFLRHCAVVGGSATVLAAAGGAAAQSVTESPVQARAERPPQGYRLTPHIREYYDKADF